MSTMRQDAQKQARKFSGKKTAKKRKTHPEKAKKGETGCVLGAGGDGSGWERIKPGAKTRSPNQSEHYDHATRAKRKPAETQSFRRFCGRGRRTWSPLRSGRLVACVPLALAHPSARGFGVDVGEHNGEQKRVGVARFFPQVTK